MTMRWYRERLAATNPGGVAPELVLLPGWGMSLEVWRPLLPRLRRLGHVTLLDWPGLGRSPAQPGTTAEALLGQLAEQLPAAPVLIGWSLGGMLAAAFTQRYPDGCAALVTLAANPRFLARHDWPGMAPSVLADFAAQAERAPQLLHRRFLALQARGAPDEGLLRRQLQAAVPAPADPSGSRWGLAALAELDARAAIQAWTKPALHIFGAADALVPAAAAEAVQGLAPAHRVTVIDDAGHLPFLSAPQRVIDELASLLSAAGLSAPEPASHRSKQAVARTFGAAAATYDQVATLQRRVASGLRQRLAATRRADAAATIDTQDWWLDLGCGTGTETLTLTGMDSAARQWLAVDLAEGMVRHASQRPTGATVQWLCGDAENLPLGSATVDGIFSSLAIQWCEAPTALFAELARVLKPGARAWLATLGPATLHELTAAWRQVDQQVHVNRFAPRHALEHAIDAAGLRVKDWDEQELVCRYPRLADLTRELKGLGATNLNAGRPVGLGGRERLQRLQSAYEPLRDRDGLLPATWQVWYLELQNDG